MLKINFQNFKRFLFALLAVYPFFTEKLYACGSGLTISSVTISAVSVGLGQNFSVTVVYQQTAGWNQVYLLGGFNPTQTTFQTCNPVTPGQDFVIYAGAPGNGDSANANNDAPPGGILVNPGGTGPATQVFTVTVPPGLNPGTTYNFIVGGSGCDAKCADLPNMESQASTPVFITLPPANCAATVLTEGVTAVPNGFYLVDVDYSIVNAGSCNFVYSLPASVTYVSSGPNAIYNAGTNSVSWDLGTVTIPQTGVLWALVSINPGTPNGFPIPNSVASNSVSCGSGFIGPVTETVQIPQLNLNKTELPSSSLSTGSPVTYNLDWTSNGQNLELYDSYDNVTVGANTTGSAVPWGYDGTNYTVATVGDSGNWTVLTDSSGNHYISASTFQTCNGGNGHYPELIRNVPGFDICGNIIVEGDLQIPATTTGPSTCTGADAHMVLACNPSQGITLKAGISLDNLPGNLFAQYNNNYQPGYWASLQDNSLPFTITPGVWYTMKTQIVYSAGAGAVSFYIQLWPRGNPSNMASVTLYDATSITGDPMPTCSGGWRAGWQADETSGTDLYSNLKIFGPGPIVSASVTDIVPTGVSYLGSSSGAVYTAGTSQITWNASAAFPTTMFSFDTAIDWWGTVSCPGPITNSFTMAASGIPFAASNSVTLTLSSCNSPTPTPTLTITPSYTPSSTPTNTFSPTPTYTPTVTVTPTITSTPTITPTFTPTPTGLHVWPNPFDPRYAVGGVLKAYQVPAGSTMDFYSLSGELVRTVGESGGIILWDGRNNNGAMVSTGIYYYVINSSGSVLLKGKVLVLIDQ